jgi:hypothetical protein
VQNIANVYRKNAFIRVLEGCEQLVASDKAKAAAAGDDADAPVDVTDEPEGGASAAAAASSAPPAHPALLSLAVVKDVSVDGAVVDVDGAEGLGPLEPVESAAEKAAAKAGVERLDVRKALELFDEVIDF